MNVLPGVMPHSVTPAVPEWFGQIVWPHLGQKIGLTVHEVGAVLVLPVPVN